MVKTRGQKAYGLQLLKYSRDILQDLGQMALFRAMLNHAGLPSDIRRININDDYPDQFPSDPDVHVPETTADDVMNGIYESLQAIMIDGRHIGDSAGSAGAGSSGAGPSAPRLSRAEEVRRQSRPTRRYSDSKFQGRGRENES